MLSGEPKTVPAALVLSFLVLNVSTALLMSFVVVNVLCAGGGLTGWLAVTPVLLDNNSAAEGSLKLTGSIPVPHSADTCP